MKEKPVKASGGCCSRLVNGLASFLAAISLGKIRSGLYLGKSITYASWFGGILSIFQLALVASICLAVSTMVGSNFNLTQSYDQVVNS